MVTREARDLPSMAFCISIKLARFGSCSNLLTYGERKGAKRGGLHMAAGVWPLIAQ
jgi:hypothetical protein